MFNKQFVQKKTFLPLITCWINRISRETKRRQPSSLTCLRPMECCPGRHKHHTSTLWRKEKCFWLISGTVSKKNQKNSESERAKPTPNKKKGGIYIDIYIYMYKMREKPGSKTTNRWLWKDTSKIQPPPSPSREREAKEKYWNDYTPSPALREGMKTETTDEEIREERKIKSKEMKFMLQSALAPTQPNDERMSYSSNVLSLWYASSNKRYPAGNGLK